MSELFNLINNMDLSIEASKVKSEEELDNYVSKLSKLMPGVKLKKNWFNLNKYNKFIKIYIF